jgi:methionine biosynthesis protein MetW
MLRVGRRVIVAFPNFGHWRVRWSHLISGRAPLTELFPYDWYDSPNVHFLTINDFQTLAHREGWMIERRIFLSGRRRVQIRPNLTAELAVYLVRK